MIDSLPNLTSLDCDYFSWDVFAAVQHQLFPKLAALRLHVSPYSKFSNVLEKCPHLKRLHLQRAPAQPSDVLPTFVMLSELTHLHLYSLELSDSCLQTFAHLTSLTFLSLNHMRCVFTGSPEILGRALSRTKLRRLQVRSFEKICVPYVGEILNHVQLQQLSIFTNEYLFSQFSNMLPRVFDGKANPDTFSVRAVTAHWRTALEHVQSFRHNVNGELF